MHAHKHTSSNSPSLLPLQTAPESEYLPEGAKQLLSSKEAPGRSPARQAGASLSWSEAQCPSRTLHPPCPLKPLPGISSPSRVCSRCSCLCSLFCSFPGLSFKCTPFGLSCPSSLHSFSDFPSLESDPVCTLIPMLSQVPSAPLDSLPP